MQTQLLLLAVAAYAATAGSCFLAARRATKIAASGRDLAIWNGCGAVFVMLVFVRYFSLEERIRSALRAMIRQSGDYAQRWEFQAPLAAAMVALGGVVLFGTLRLWPAWRHHPFHRASHYALIATLWFLPLIGLRLVSLHATDRLLYAGPIRMNWLVDGALTATVACSAAYFAFAALPSGATRRQSDGDIKG